MTKNIFNRLKFCLMVYMASGPLVVVVLAQEAVSNSPAVLAPVAVVQEQQEQVVSTQAVESAAVQESAGATITTNVEAGIDQTNVPVEAAADAVEIREDAVGTPDEALLAGGESRSQRAVRLNRNLMVGCITVLSFFIVCRLALLWQITRNRKKLPREENAFEN